MMIRLSVLYLHERRSLIIVNILPSLETDRKLPFVRRGQIMRLL